MEPKEKIIEVFRNNGFRATPQRIAIAQAVINNKDHPTAEQVLEIVARNNPSISLSTVYNTRARPLRLAPTSVNKQLR